ncbi:MAG: acyl transferase/acyl hydrolase/lysophospholipase [Monoraphidium minutum]|nr:MAG: acyl transferase/acyl hydrolase/lysophospholipase [Monoraphidium minutum]
MRGRLAAPAAAAAPCASASPGAAAARRVLSCRAGLEARQPIQRRRLQQPGAPPAPCPWPPAPRHAARRAALLEPAVAALAPELLTLAAAANAAPPAAPPARPPLELPFVAAAPPQRPPTRQAQAPPAAALTPLPPHDHPVLDLLRSRLRDGSAPGARSDGFKLGLVVEGGGMRGIVTGAMLMGLLDARGAFDAVYGASAGAMNASYYLTGQPEGLDIYTDHLAASEQFLSLRRYWVGGGPPAMDLGYLVDEVMSRITPLDWRGVIDSPVPLKVVASSLDTLRAELMGDFGSVTDLKESLRASANVPSFAGEPRLHRGHRLVDAAVFEPIPVKSAVRDGCTHVLALCSRPPSSGPAWGKMVRRTLTATVKHIMFSPPYMKDAWRVEHLHSTVGGQPLEELLAAMAAGRADSTLDMSDEDRRNWPGLSGGAPEASRQEGEAVDADMAGRRRAEGVRAADGFGGSHVLPIYPSAAAAFAPVCTHVPTLLRGRRDGYEAVTRVLLPALAPRPAR